MTIPGTMSWPCPAGCLPLRLPLRLPLLLLLLLLLPATNARRQLPDNLRDRDLFCETCYSVTTEMYQIVKKTPEGSLEQRIDGALTQVCSPKRLGRYAYPADLLTASCRDLIVRFENDLGLGLMATFQPGNKPRAATTIKDICIARTKACKKTSSIPSLRQNNGTSHAAKTSSTPATVTSTPATVTKDHSEDRVTGTEDHSEDRVTGTEDQQTAAPAVAGKDEL